MPWTNFPPRVPNLVFFHSFWETAGNAGPFRIHVVFATTYYRTLRCIFSIGCHNNPHQTGQTVRIRGRDLKWSSYPSRFQPVGSVDRLEYNNNLCIESNENCQTLCVRGRHTQILARPPQIPMVERKVLLQNYHFFRIHVSFPESRFFGLLVGLINQYIYIYIWSIPTRLQ